MHTASMASSPDPPADGESPSLTWQYVETLEVTEIVLAILQAQRTMPWATAATVSREKHGDVFHVRVTMLKSSPSAPADHRERPADPSSGSEVIAAFAVRRLGDDLAIAFGDGDVITLK